TWQLGDLGYVIHYAHRLPDAFREFPHVIYQPMTYSDEEFSLFFGHCLALQNYTLIIDEVDRFARPRHYVTDNLREIVNRGRRQGIGLIANSRRPASTHMDLRSNADYVVTFHLHETRDVDYVSEWIGVDEVAPNPLKELRGHESILWSANTGEWIKQQKCPT
ncbi:MAG: ATP-binding protein, partial [Desulfobacterales bacterium]|nr:ATP-binding protein [Desulfobacterales bacterium]